MLYRKPAKAHKDLNKFRIKRSKRTMKVKHLKDHATTAEMRKLDLLLNKNGCSNDEEHMHERLRQIAGYKAKLYELQKLPYIKQRTEEWFNLRKDRLTASDLEDAIKENNIRLAKKKAGVIKDTTNYTGIPALKWGVMFEPMASRCYSQANDNIDISEFGLIAHPTLEHFGASPDGINALGIMIEIKCPYSREIIDNSIPDKYYMQIQGQLAVCGLEECDYIECDFKTFDSAYKYVDDMVNDHGNPTINHGIIAEYKNLQTDEYEYFYSDVGLNASQAFNNINKQVFEANKRGHLQFIKLTPWILEKMNIQRVTFDKDLWDETVPKILKFWDKVEKCKQLPIEEPEPKRKQKITFIQDDD